MIRVATGNPKHTGFNSVGDSLVGTLCNSDKKEMPIDRQDKTRPTATGAGMALALSKNHITITR